MRSGVRRASVRSRLRWRTISCPAANEMRWVNPSMATVSPSRTRSAIASRIVATLEAVIGSVWTGGGGWAGPLARGLDLGQRAGCLGRVQDGPATAGDGADRLGEDPQCRRHLVLADSQGRRHPDTGGTALQYEQAALEAGPLDR